MFLTRTSGHIASQEKMTCTDTGMRKDTNVGQIFQSQLNDWEILIPVHEVVMVMAILQIRNVKL